MRSAFKTSARVLIHPTYNLSSGIEAVALSDDIVREQLRVKVENLLQDHRYLYKEVR